MNDVQFEQMMDELRAIRELLERSAPQAVTVSLPWLVAGKAAKTNHGVTARQ